MTDSHWGISCAIKLEIRLVRIIFGSKQTLIIKYVNKYRLKIIRHDVAFPVYNNVTYTDVVNDIGNHGN